MGVVVSGCVYFAWPKAPLPTTVLSIALIISVVGAFYPYPPSIPWLYAKLSVWLAPTAKGEITETFSAPLQSIYQGRIRGWLLGAWGAKGPPQANFGMTMDHGPDGKPGYVVLVSGNQAYFEYMPETLRHPRYYDLNGGTFSVDLKTIGAVKADGKPHIFVCGGRNYSCYFQEQPLEIGPEWTHVRTVLSSNDFIVEAGYPDVGAESVLARVGYIGLMYISSGGGRNDVDLRGLIGIDNFHFASAPDVRG